MPTVLLSTKLFIPPPRPQLVPRPRLTERLNDGLTRPLTLISAPPGFGKTTLLSEWHIGAGPDMPLAWLSLDADDNATVRFLTYLIASLETLRTGIGRDSLALLQSLQAPSLKAVLTTLINSLSEVSPEFAVVLEDYHVIDAAPIHEGLAFLLDRLPPNMHLIITSRADPPLPLSRLRARGLLTELRAADLRFTQEEAADYLIRLMGLDLATKDVAALEARTEGWVTGLQLAALSMQRHEDIPSFIKSFTGDDRYVLDYLVEEVFQRQPQDVKTFLLQTSILGRFFIVPLDNQRLWYRYHHLFAAFLRERLRRERTDQVAELHRRASEWYAGNGLTEEAVGHALSASDFEGAARLIERVAEDMIWKEGRIPKLMGWVATLREDIVRARPCLSLNHAWALLATGQADAVEARLRDVERAAEAGIGPEPNASLATIRTMLGEVALIRAMHAHHQGDTTRSLTLARLALDSLAESQKSLRGFAVGMIGIAYHKMSDAVAAGEAFTEAAQMSQASGNLTAALLALGQLVDVRVALGQLHQAAATYRQTVDLAATWQLRASPALGVALLGMGKVSYEWNDLSEAERYLREGIESCGQWGGLAEMTSLRGYLHLARVLLARGDIAGARRMIEQTEQVSRGYHVPEGVACAAAMQARLAMHPARRNLAEAARWAASREGELSGDGSPSHAREMERLTLARVFIAQNRLADAEALLDRLLQSAETAEAAGRVIEILVLQAVTRQAQGNMAQAMLAVSRALSQAEPGGYVRVFLDEGAPVVRLLREAESRGIARDYVRKLLSAFGAAASSLVPVLVDPLSERELEVLRLIAAGLSPQEIADKLVITVGTVRNHVKNIYGKLDAHSRLQAVDRARALNLL